MENVTINGDLEAMQERADRLAKQKSYLQLIIGMMQKLGKESGLKNTVESLLETMIVNIGGTNATLHFFIGDEIYKSDIQHGKIKIENITDEYVKKVIETHEFIEIEHEFTDTLLQTPEFTKAFTWVIPLVVGHDLTGVIKIDDLHITSQEFKDELSAFFNYAAIILKNDILEFVNLRNIQESLAIEQKLNKELIEKNCEYEALNEEYLASNEELRQTGHELMAAYESVKQSETKYKSLIDSTDALIFSLDREYRYTSFNPGHASVMKAIYGAEIKIGHSLLDYMTMPDDRGKAKYNLDRALAGEHLTDEAYSGEELRSRLFFQVSHNPIRTEEGEIIGVVVFSQDITERKKAEEALFEGQQVFRTLVENSPDIIARYDRECRRTYVNPTYLKVAQIPRPELLATSPLQHSPLPASSAWVLQNLLRKVLDTGIAEAVDVIWPKSDNIDYWYNIYASPEFDREGKIISVMSVSRDITERKKAEGEVRKLNQELEQRVAERTVKLEALNKELEAFAYSVSHDLRAPLRAIDGFSHVLLEEYQDKVDNQGKDYLQRVRSAAQRMAQLIDDLLSLSHVNRSDMIIQQVTLSKMFREIAANLKETKPERDVEFIIQEGIEVSGDGRLMRIVLENLIGNAWKFTSRHLSARIEFGMLQQNKVPVYFIRDDGAGFDMNYASKLFGAFQRLHTESEFQGTGIGLATVQRIIHRHGGRVWAEGEVEKGATIYFTIVQ